MAPEQRVRVRIAPSPTGYLHLGTVRTALCNFLFAKKEGGDFIVRIEDTDQSRSLPLYEQDILEGLKILGLNWDEGPDIGGKYGPYRQSERGNIYKKYIDKLINEGKVYRCFCTKEQLEEDRKAMIAQGLAPKYGGQCKNLTKDQISAYEKEGKESVLRLRVPSEQILEFSDMIRGVVKINSSTIGDFIIAKDEASPLYNFAVVVDDAEMQISHVIRGEDHIPNTPKQILIQQAIGVTKPIYAHLPLVLSPDRSKLSKRSLETSFIEYIKDGYLPEALLNFIVLLGWHPEGDDEIISLERMIKEFSIKRVQKSGAVFDMQRLDWFNFQYIKRLSDDELVERIKIFVPEQWLENIEMFKRAIHIERDRMQKLSDFSTSASFFFEMPEYEISLLQWQNVQFKKTLENLEYVKKIISSEEEIMKYAEKEGRGDVLWPLRVSLSGMKNSPGPFEIIFVIGEEESLKRIDLAIQKIKNALSE